MKKREKEEKAKDKGKKGKGFCCENPVFIYTGQFNKKMFVVVLIESLSNGQYMINY